MISSELKGHVENPIHLEGTRVPQRFVSYHIKSILEKCLIAGGGETKD